MSLKPHDQDVVSLHSNSSKASLKSDVRRAERKRKEQQFKDLGNQKEDHH